MAWRIEGTLPSYLTIGDVVDIGTEDIECVVSFYHFAVAV